MGLQGAMNSAVSGLSAQGNAMSVIGNNISNSNTTAYKANRALFSDVLAQEVSSAGGNSQVGRGVNTATVDPDFSQGTFKGSSSNTDLAVDGPGFFIMSEEGSDEKSYTRDGAFSMNKDGFLENPTGQRVQGQDLATGTVDSVQIDPNSTKAAEPTTQVGTTANLNSESAQLSAGSFDSSDSSTYNFETSSKVYDSLGNSHTLSTYFLNADSSPNQWKVFVEDDSGNRLASGENMEFDPADGTLNSGDSFTMNDVSLDPGAANQDITMDFAGTTQFSSQSEVIQQDVNGNGPGKLENVNVKDDGTVQAIYSNGETEDAYQLRLAQFANESALQREGNNLYSAPDAAGKTEGWPGSGSSVGTIRSNSLEQSNVDIAKQFTDMITTQRAYQANSRTISTTKDMLQEVINLTR